MWQVGEHFHQILQHRDWITVPKDGDEQLYVNDVVFYEQCRGRLGEYVMFDAGDVA